MRNNPWRTLNTKIQYSLFGPLEDTAPWLLKKREFHEWYEKYYQRKKPFNTGITVNYKSAYPEWYFNHALTSAARNSLLCVHAKMEKEDLWKFIKTIIWVGDTGNILFNPVGTTKFFHNHLLNNGYGDWWFASSRSNAEWGVRSRLCGGQLHFIKISDKEAVDGHIDINNPGDPSEREVTGAISEIGDAIYHLRKDSFDRENTHRPHQIRYALLKQGIKVPLTK